MSINRDKETSLGLLNKLNSVSELKVDHQYISGGYDGYSQCTFELDGFNIRITEEEGPARIFGIPVASDGGYSYSLTIDSVYIRPGYKIGSKIYKRAKFLSWYNKEEIEEKEFIRKDAHGNFSSYL